MRVNFLPPNIPIANVATPTLGANAIIMYVIENIIPPVNTTALYVYRAPRWFNIGAGLNEETKS